MKKITIAIISIIAIILILLFAQKFHTKQDVFSSENKVQIVFITDEKYVTYLRTAIKSVIANKNPETNIKIFVLGLNLQDKQIKKIIGEKRKNTEIEFIPIPENLLKDYKNKKIKKHQITFVDTTKFFLSEILKDVDKVLYLDADTIVLKDLSQFYFSDLEDNYIGAIDDWQSDWKHEPEKRYFNSGVMLLNLAKIREDNIKNKLIEFEKNDTVKRFMTQDAFNTVMYGKVKYFPLIYDTFAPEFDESNIKRRIRKVLGKNYDAKTYGYKDDEEYRKNVVIIHYCGYDYLKPWAEINFYQKSKRIWYKYSTLEFWLGCLQGKCTLSNFYNQ